MKRVLDDSEIKINHYYGGLDGGVKRTPVEPAKSLTEFRRELERDGWTYEGLMPTDAYYTRVQARFTKGESGMIKAIGQASDKRPIFKWF